jgi:hypothetical protein
LGHETGRQTALGSVGIETISRIRKYGNDEQLIMWSHPKRTMETLRWSDPHHVEIVTADDALVFVIYDHH